MLAKFAALIWTLSVLLGFTIRACPVYLTTALGDSIWSSTRVQVNWGPDCHEKPEWIGVFTEDPSVSNIQPRAKITDVTNSSGSFVTDLDVGWRHVEWNRNSGKDYPNGQCIRYFVASFKGAELLTVECFKIRPMWMSKSAHVSDMPLKSLFIPGTHASGAFDNHEKSELITDFAFAQQVDVWSQLVFGIRFLDISIGVKTERENMTESYDYWIVNENMFVTKFVPILRDVRRFVKMSGEVVIIDFRSFPIGFYKRPDRHIEVLRIIEKEIGDLAYIRNSSTDPNFNCYDLTVNEVRRSGKNLLLIYPIEELPYPDSESKILCSTWKTFDLKSMDTSESLDFMRLLFAKKNDSLVQDEGWIFHAVLSLEQGLRRNTKVPSTTARAKDINPKLSNWLGGPWSLTANVVTVDYFTSTNLIDIAIYANLHKAFTWANKNLTRFEVID